MRSPAAAAEAEYVRETPQEAARAARLRYVSDQQPGIQRERNPDGTFRYIGVDGEAITDSRTLARIQSLCIPPAYTDVWICPVPNGHLQATGRDARGRKQYRYHPRWRSVRDETKYDRMLAFGEALPRLRARVEQDLSLPGLSRQKVLATVIRLLEETRIRVGNEEYARQNHSFGLTTLRNQHVAVEGSRLHFHFRGKSGKEHAIDIRDARVARVIRRLRDLEGQELFQYVDSGTGERHPISSGDVNAYLQQATGEEFTAKDFRTWAGTILCAEELAAFSRPTGDESAAGGSSATAVKAAIVAAVRRVAERLGNTPAICRKCYIHPAVLDAFQQGILAAALASDIPEDGCSSSLEPTEAALLAFLRTRGPSQEPAAGAGHCPAPKLAA